MSEQQADENPRGEADESPQGEPQKTEQKPRSDFYCVFMFLRLYFFIAAHIAKLPGPSE